MQQSAGAGSGGFGVNGPADVLAKVQPPAPAAPGQAPLAATAPGYRATQSYTQQSRALNGKTFYQNGNRWSDAESQTQRQQLKRRHVKFNSEEYFALVKNNTAAAQWLSLGNDVDVVIGDTLYEVRDN
jgi:hypothetical protein